ncbi:MAG: hypothetical protein AB1649_07095 [Chloroflexota bacterium]
MPTSQYRARQVGAKTHEVFEYHRDEARPGKPLHLLIPGGLVALATLALVIYVAYLTWFTGDLAQDTGLFLMILLAPFYVGGVFLFSYGYELYDMKRALRLTAIIVFVTLAAVVIIAVLFFLLGESKGGSSSGSSKSSSSKSGGGSKGRYSSSASRSSGSSSHSGVGSGGAIIIDGLGSTRTRTVTKEVTREVPVAPRSIACPFCGRSYVPAEQKYACPACGAATPKEWIEESEAPKQI